jgi:hypothetical protein
MSARKMFLAAVFACVTLAAWGRVITVSFNSLETEPNETHAKAGFLLRGGSQAPSYYPATDVDYYRLDVGDGPSTLTLYVQGVSSVVISGDPEVWLEDTTGTVLAHNDDIAPVYNLDCFLRYVFTAPGDYYVRVQHSAKSQWYYNYSNYTLSGEYAFISAVAVRPNRWMLYR